MGGIASVLYGAAVYLLFFGTILYAIAFTGNFAVPRTIDSGAEGALVPALVIDTLLLGLFATSICGSIRSSSAASLLYSPQRTRTVWPRSVSQAASRRRRNC